MKYLIHILFLISSLPQEQCPEFEDTIDAYSKLLSDSDYVSMNFEVITIGESAKWNDASEMNIIWHDGQVLYLDSEFERLVTREFSVLVNHESQSIDVIRYTTPLSKIDVSNEMDKWLAQNNGNHTMECDPTKDKLSYIFYSKTIGPVKEASYEFSADGRLLRRISQTYDKSYSKINQVIMKFTDYDFQSGEHLSRFSSDHYFNKSDASNKMIKSGSYAGYQLIINEGE